jgi:hypothetical protein
MPTKTEIILRSGKLLRAGKPDANWRKKWVPEGDVEPCICSPYGPCRYHEKLLESKQKH